MKRSFGQAVFWAGVYIALSVLPLALVLVGPLPVARGFWIEFAVGLGFVGLAMLGLQFALTARFRPIAAPFGLDTMLHFHRQAGIVAFMFILAHPLLLLVLHPVFLEFLDPRSSIARALALWVALGSLALLVMLTLWRRPLGVAYEWWRATHGILALLVVFIGLVHVLRVGHYISGPWKQAVWVAMSGGAILLLLYSRLVKPLLLARQPYRVAEVRPERGDSWTVALEPDEHDGLDFTAGQFAWVTFGPSPFSLEQHPFSFSSSARRSGRLEFTIKELGDFTATIGKIPPGTRAFVEGPYGAFTLSPDASAAVFVVGGVGITPVMSILRTLADDGDRRPLLLIYAHSRLDAMTFREELQELSTRLDLRIVDVLEDPHAGWDGESGFVEPRLLERQLATFQPLAPEYFVCGPEPMMDVVETHLIGRGVRLRKLNSERFNIA
ncbi:MAG: ferric reductase-like transmembrane domain-containing protein [Gemmatimonadetes bacterium]|nr:ferric reductase-like transmembrane domain-containing protein [Gemmatimonadota bacterium]